jgi:hypothetical protein
MKPRELATVARKVAKQVRGTMLAAAFVAIRREGLTIRVASIDDKPVQPSLSEPNVVNVDVVNGFVRRSWANATFPDRSRGSRAGFSKRF